MTHPSYKIKTRNKKMKYGRIWASNSPIVVVKKKNGESRICVDFRKINDKTRKDNDPLPLIDDMVTRVRQVYLFSTLDLQNGYNNISKDKESIPITALSGGTGLYKYTVMPYGLTGAPATFQRVMNLMSIDIQHAMVYIDDIIIFSKNFKIIKRT